MDAVRQWTDLCGTPVDRGLLLELEAQIAALQTGSLERPEALLAGHIETLDAIFHGLIKMAHEYRGNARQYDLLKLALRVDARMAANIRTLSEIKNPRPVAYVQQANIGNAVQVNNGSQRRSGESGKPP
jgi:hypothetical protein